MNAGRMFIELKPREEAVVSVFDSGFVLGDGVWEGLRVHKGRIAFLDRHLDRQDVRLDRQILNNDDNDFSDVFVRDLATATTQLAIPSPRSSR